MSLHEHLYDIKFSNGISFTFGKDTMILMYDKEDQEIARIDPVDLGCLYAAHRRMVQQDLEEDRWAEKEIN